MDKPAGPTSHDVIAVARRALGTRAVGHTGTLDPFATGLLVVLTGKATRLARFVEQQRKTYLATARLGVRTSTDDATGEVIQHPAAAALEPPTRAAVETALQAFLGPQRQRPPAYSAKRVGGERSYARARRGETVELAEVDVEVHALELVRYQWPELEFRAVVGPGTYIRALARDLGDRLGTGAHLIALRREAIGALQVRDAVPLDRVGPGALRQPLEVLGHLPRLDVSETEARAIGYGQAVSRTGGQGETGPVAAVAPGERLVAVGEIRDGGFHPAVVLESNG